MPTCIAPLGALLGVLLSLPRARATALSNPEEWAEFADRFATDLAPILTLFGEQVTKQFLSESISPLDCVIFGMAPIGIITAVVSVIRLYGKSWLKSVIGRAQEPHGAPEAELCSSTSEDVCEMWSNGSICRVFGRPKMLEVIVHNDGIFYPRVISDAMEETGADCGIALPKNLLGYLPHPTDISARIPKEQLPWTQWVETSRPRGLEGMKYPRPFAPFPNLSLNIGFQQPKRSLLSTAAAFGIILQSSFFIYAYWATFSNTSFYPEGDRPQIWSFVLAVAGTILLVSGMTLCAALVEGRSGERHFKFNPADDKTSSSTRIYWLQCGNQRIADQHFPSFAYCKGADGYTTSWLAKPEDVTIIGLPSGVVYPVAIAFSLAGFVCQFLGLRGLHGSITLYQLACTLVMSVVRASIRGQRISKDSNLMEDFVQQNASDDLDWLAMEIAKQHQFPADGLTQRPILWTFWRILNSEHDFYLPYWARSESAKGVVASATDNQVTILVSKGAAGVGLVGFRAIAEVEYGPDVFARQTLPIEGAVAFLRLIEGSQRFPDSEFPRHRCPDDYEEDQHAFPVNPISRAASIRARLGNLARNSLEPHGLEWDPELQHVARKLQEAIQNAAGYVFREIALCDVAWKHIKAFVWSIPCQFGTWYHNGSDDAIVHFPLHFLVRRDFDEQQWRLDANHLAAALSLWRYHFHGPDHSSATSRDQSGPISAYKIIQAADDEHVGAMASGAIIRFWVGADCPISFTAEPRKRALQDRLVPYKLSAPYVRHADWKSSGRFTTFSSMNVHILSIPTKTTLLYLMAQDIFTSFMFAAASVVDNLGNFAVRQPLWPGETILRNRDGSSSFLRNPHIDALARILCESGLAEEEAALMCIVPAFYHQDKLPSFDRCITTMLEDVRLWCGDGKYELGEAFLKRLLRCCQPLYQKRVARALGELYRSATKSATSSHHDLGIRGMASLRELARMTTEWGRPLSPSAISTLGAYWELFESISQDFTARGSSRQWDLVARPRLTFDVVEEVRNTAPQSNSTRSHIRALILCRRHDLSDPSNPSVQELLFVAIMLRHVEVVEELRSRNPNLVIQSAPVASERQSLTGRIVRKLIATGSQAAVTVGFLAVLWAAEQLQKDPEVRQEAEEVLKAVVDWVYLMDHPVDQQGDTPLMYAVRSNNVTAVSVLLEKGVDFRVIDSYGDNAFSIANHRGYYSIAERILQESRRRGCRLPPETLRDALDLALRLNMQDMIKAILLNDANNDFDEKIDATPAAIDVFFYPQTGGLSMDPINSESRRPGPSVDPNFIQMVIDHGTPVAPEDVLPVVLKMAVELAKSEWIRHLHSLQAHDVINWVNKHRIIRILLERYPPSDRRETADSFLESLLDIGASVHPADLDLDLLTRPSLRVMVAILGKTKPAINEYIPYDSRGTLIQQLLDNSSFHGTAAEQDMWLEALLAAGCDPNQTSLWGWRSVTNAGAPQHLLTYTPFQMACARSQFCSAPSGCGYVRADPIYYSDQLPLILLRGGAAPWGRVSSWKQTFPGAPPLVLACLTGKLEVVEAILKLEPYSDNPAQLLRRFECWHTFGTPLQAACLWFGQRDDDPDVSVRLVKTLLAAGDKVTFSSLPCGSPLIAATFSLLPEVVEVLLAAGADPTIPEPVNGLINSQFRINAWEALEPWNEMLVEFLVSHFNSFQTGNFTCGPRRDAASNEQRRERIRELFSLYRPSPSRGVYQQIPIGLYDPSTDDRDDKLDDAFGVFPLGMPVTKPSWRTQITQWFNRLVARRRSKHHPLGSSEDIEFGLIPSQPPPPPPPPQQRQRQPR